MAGARIRAKLKVDFFVEFWGQRFSSVLSTLSQATKKHDESEDSVCSALAERQRSGGLCEGGLPLRVCEFEAEIMASVPSRPPDYIPGGFRL